MSYAVERRLARGQPDYWDHATRLELAVLARDEPAAERALAGRAGSCARGGSPRPTANNLRLIREAREHRGEEVPWAETIERELVRRAGQPGQAPNDLYRGRIAAANV